jgi:hypothetical protein
MSDALIAVACPFCRTAREISIETRVNRDRDADRSAAGRIGVRCAGCELRGPDRDDAAGAIAAWNYIALSPFIRQAGSVQQLPAIDTKHLESA